MGFFKGDVMMMMMMMGLWVVVLAVATMSSMVITAEAHHHTHHHHHHEWKPPPPPCPPPAEESKCFEKVKFTVWDKELIQVALNLEYLEAEFFLWSSVGKGLDTFAPYLTKQGPPPIGVQKANLPPLLADTFFQFGLQEIGHLRAIHKGLKEFAFPRPLLDVSNKTWAKFFDKALGKELKPPFDPYCNSLNYVLSAYMIPYVGLTGYVDASPLLFGKEAKKLMAGLLAVESGQDAIIRSFLYQNRHKEVKPYGIAVAEFTDKISCLRNELSHGMVDEGLVVPRALRSKELAKGNLLSADKDSLAYGRTPEQVFATVYGNGNASKPGGFYPKGAHGKIAWKYLHGSGKKKKHMKEEDEEKYEEEEKTNKELDYEQHEKNHKRKEEIEHEKKGIGKTEEYKLKEYKKDGNGKEFEKEKAEEKEEYKKAYKKKN